MDVSKKKQPKRRHFWTFYPQASLRIALVYDTKDEAEKRKPYGATVILMREVTDDDA
tara:strand:- start:509 stop:679 length:171 start_codon:yes stop_codon:yes gene_type:complete